LAHGRGDHAPVKAFSNDDSGDADEISIARGDYALAMEEILAAAGKPLDLIGFDACLMGTRPAALGTASYAGWVSLKTSTARMPLADIQVDNRIPRTMMVASKYRTKGDQ